MTGMSCLADARSRRRQIAGGEGDGDKKEYTVEI